MKIKKKYLSWSTGYIRFNKIELNYSVSDWSLPLSITIEKYSNNHYLIFIRVLCISLIFTNKYTF